MIDQDAPTDDILETLMANVTETGLRRKETPLAGTSLRTVEVMYLMSLVPDKIPMVTALVLLIRMTEALHGIPFFEEASDDAERMH